MMRAVLGVHEAAWDTLACSFLLYQIPPIEHDCPEHSRGAKFLCRHSESTQFP